MRTFYHQILDPSCRAIRVMLGEKRLECSLVEATGAQEFPVLVEENDASIPYAFVIAEYLNEAYPDPDLLGYDPMLRVDVRRIGQYFASNIDTAVTQPLLSSKLYGSLHGTIASPNATAGAKVAMQGFMQFIELLDDNNNWLAGPSFSIADIFAAAHISTLDFMGVIDWREHVAVQRWYRRIKSRRAMASVLADQVDGFEPPAHYADPDF